MSSDALVELEARGRVHELLDELGIYSAELRGAMTDDPERAIVLLEHASRARGIRNRPAFAIARWRAGDDPRPSSPSRALGPPPAEPEASPPTLEALELAWHLEDEGSPVAAPVLRLIAAGIERAGGCRAALYRPDLFADQ
jgi:hypothetical protein